MQALEFQAFTLRTTFTEQLSQGCSLKSIQNFSRNN